MSDKTAVWRFDVSHNGCTPDYDCVCSECGASGTPDMNKCPKCGATMTDYIEAE